MESFFNSSFKTFHVISDKVTVGLEWSQVHGRELGYIVSIFIWKTDMS